MLAGCASSAMPSTVDQASLLHRCRPLATPADGTAAELLRWGVDTALAYRECDDRHDMFVRAIRR